jgi:1-acyl-sn-glycerol-3-phosphate acyltransferase
MMGETGWQQEYGRAGRVKMDLLSRILKILWLGLWLGLATLTMFAPVTVSALLDSTGNLPFSLSKVWAWITLKVTGVRPEVRGREKIRKGESYIIIPNHQSHFDALALVTTLGIQFRWIAKKELLKVPLFGHALYLSRNIFIDRSDKKTSIKGIREGMNRLPPGASALFFAEGTRSPDGMIQEFKKGGFATAIERGLPILPVTINGSRKALPKGSIVFYPGQIEVVIGDPIEAKGYTVNRLEELVNKTRDIVISNFNPDYPEK